MNTFSRGNLSLRLTILIKTTISFEIRIITSFILFWGHTTSIRIDKYIIIIIIIIVNHVYLCAVTGAPPVINAVYAHWQIMHTCETFIVLEGVELSKLDRFDKEKSISVDVRWSLLLFLASRSVDGVFRHQRQQTIGWYNAYRRSVQPCVCLFVCPLNSIYLVCLAIVQTEQSWPVRWNKRRQLLRVCNRCRPARQTTNIPE